MMKFNDVKNIVVDQDYILIFMKGKINSTEN